MRRRLATLAAITALAATGCGSDYGSDDSGNKSGGGADQTETTTPPSTTDDKPKGGAY